MARRVYAASPVLAKLSSQKVKLPIFSIIFLSILLCGSGICATIALSNKHENVQIIQMWDGVRDNAEIPVYANDDGPHSGHDGQMSAAEGYVAPETPVRDTDPMHRQFDWSYLQTANSDTACWLYIPDTTIDYPVMQEPTVREYFYLRHDFDKKYLKSGCLFIPKEPEGFTGTDSRLLIFGHNMPDEDIMFHSLLNYKDEEFYLAHPYIYVYYPDRVEKWQVWAALGVQNSDDLYDLPLESNTQKYDNLLTRLDTDKKYNAADKPDCNDNILTLSTCDRTNGGADGRFVVNAVLVETEKR